MPHTDTASVYNQPVLGGFAPLPTTAGPHPLPGPPDRIERRARQRHAARPASSETGRDDGGAFTRVRATDLPPVRQFPRFIASIAPCCFRHAIRTAGSAGNAGVETQGAFAEAVRSDMTHVFAPRMGRLTDDARAEATATVERIIAEAFQYEAERAGARLGASTCRNDGPAAIAGSVSKAIMEKNFLIWAHEEQLHRTRAALRRSVLAGLGYSAEDMATLDPTRYRTLMEEVQAEVEHRLRVARSQTAVTGFGAA